MKNSLEHENQKLQDQLGLKLEKDAIIKYENKEQKMEQSVLAATVTDLQEKLE